MNKSILVILCWLTMVITAHARNSEPDVFIQKNPAERGDLRIIQRDEGRVGNEFAVPSEGRVVVQTGRVAGSSGFRFDDYPLPNVLLRRDKGVVPVDEVFFLQERLWGNACDSGPVWFLGDASDGSYPLFEAIDTCGGPPPFLSVLPEKVIVTDHVPLSR
jgi:hypothetical protein